MDLFPFEIVARDSNGKLLFNRRVQAPDAAKARESSEVDKYLKGSPAVVAVVQIDQDEIMVGWTPTRKRSE